MKRIIRISLFLTVIIAAAPIMSMKGNKQQLKDKLAFKKRDRVVIPTICFGASLLAIHNCFDGGYSSRWGIVLQAVSGAICFAGSIFSYRTISDDVKKLEEKIKNYSADVSM